MPQETKPTSAANTGGRNRNSFSTHLRSRLTFDAATVKAAIDIVEVIGEHIALRRVGAKGRYVGLCPFHQEKTPSFNVNRDRTSYRCFGCSAHGDVFTFLMAIDGLSFSDAVRVLGERSGIAGHRRTATESRRYAQATARADDLAVRLAEFARGLELATDDQLATLSDALEFVGIDPSEALAHLHRGRYVLSVARQETIATTFDAMELSDPEAVRRIESMGRADRENAAMITRFIVDILATSQQTELTA